MVFPAVNALFSLEHRFLNWGAWKVRKGDTSMAATYFWEVLSALFLSVNFSH